MLSYIGRGVRIVLTASAFLFFFLGGCMLSWIVLPLIALRWRVPNERARRCQAILHHAYRLFHSYMNVMQLLRFTRPITALSLPAGPYVLIANHPTLVDVTAIMSSVKSLCVVVKPALFRNIFLGHLLRYCWHIPAGDDLATATDVMASCAERLAKGFPVLIFPEGTRSPLGGLHRFKRGALDIARRAGVPVVLLWLECSPSVLNHDLPWYYVPQRVPRLIIEQLKQVEPSELQDTRDTMRTIHASYAARVAAGRYLN